MIMVRQWRPEPEVRKVHKKWGGFLTTGPLKMGWPCGLALTTNHTWSTLENPPWNCTFSPLWKGVCALPCLLVEGYIIQNHKLDKHGKQLHLALRPFLAKSNILFYLLLVFEMALPQLPAAIKLLGTWALGIRVCH